MNLNNQKQFDQLKYWLGLTLVDGIGSAKFRALLERFGSPAAAWQAGEFDLVRLGLDKRTLSNLKRTREAIDLDAELARVQRAGIHLIPFNADRYPAFLKEVPNPPMLLYALGELSILDTNGVALVGTRRMTNYGRQMASRLATGLVRNGVTVVSGLARGIDTVAHQAALDDGGTTIAVLGSGFGEIYPPENRELARKIVSGGQGLLLSEYALDTKPQAKNFPPRNRIISGLTRGTCIIEGELKSGAMITVKFALEQNREVFAVPGNATSPNSVGPNVLLQQGAKLVMTVDDILDELQLSKIENQIAMQRVLPESAEEADILPLLSPQPLHIDEITRQSNMPAALVGSTLSLLELKGVVRHLGGMHYVLT